MNPCERFKESIFDLADNELDILRKKELERHLKTCTPCSRLLEQIRRLRSHCKQLTPIQVSEEFHVLLRERIRREMIGKKGALTPSISFSGRWIPVFGMMLVMICVGFWMLDQKTSLLGTSQNSVAILQSSKTNQQNFDGEVQYVIDDYRDPVSISHMSDEGQEPMMYEDSLFRMIEQESIQNRLTPVSF